MKKIVFQKLKINNFLSVGDTGIDISFNKGINLITGLNQDSGGKNGIGKSTIADAIFWCLFGSPIRDIKKDKLQHNKNNNECKVVLFFSVKTESDVKNYSLTRILNPSKVELYCDDQDITQSTIQKNEEFIKALIGANEEVFNNCVIMTANNTLPFMAQKKVDKRKFIEGILQLNIFSEMLLKTRSEYNDLKKEHDIISNNFINEQKNLEIFEKQKQNGESQKLEKIKNIQDKINLNNTTLKNINKEKILSETEIDDSIKNFSNQIKILQKGIDKENLKIQNQNKKETEIKLKISQKQVEKNNFLKKGNKCPTCNREYCKEDVELVHNKVTDIDSQIKLLTEQLEEIKPQQKDSKNLITKINNGIKTIEENKTKILEKKSEIKVRNEKIKNILEKNKEYEKYIDDIKKEKNDYDQNIENTKNKILQIEEKLKTIKKQLQILNSVKFILSEEGIKTFIIKKILNILNNRLNFYLKELNAPCTCFFDEVFEESIYNLDKKECSYFNFSGGERKRIDLAILFMFQDLLKFQSNVEFSLNIYDELFDSALDDDGADKVLEILKNKVEKYNESIYIISHKNCTKSHIENVIQLEKKNGVTFIKS